MDAVYLGRHELILEIPRLTSEGDAFNLRGPRFSPGSIGRVTKILAQNAGRTRVRMSIIQGRILSRNQMSRVAEQAQREEQESLEKRDFEDDVRKSFEEGEQDIQDDGGSWMDFDPRPRSGENSSVVDSSQQGVDESATDEGPRIIIKGGESPGNGKAAPLSSGDRDFSRKRSNTPSISDIVDSVVGLGGADKRKCSSVTQEEVARSMGMKIDTGMGEVGAWRKSRTKK